MSGLRFVSVCVGLLASTAAASAQDVGVEPLSGENEETVPGLLGVDDLGVETLRRDFIREETWTDPGAPPLPLMGNEFVPPGMGFFIVAIPRGVTLHQVSGEPLTWVLRDRDGEQIAIVMAAEWREMMRDDPNAVFGSSLRSSDRSFDARWGGRGGRIIRDQIAGATHLYRIERLEGESDWLLYSWVQIEPGIAR